MRGIIACVVEFNSQRFFCVYRSGAISMEHHRYSFNLMQLYGLRVCMCVSWRYLCDDNDEREEKRLIQLCMRMSAWTKFVLQKRRKIQEKNLPNSISLFSIESQPVADVPTRDVVLLIRKLLYWHLVGFSLGHSHYHNM